MSGDDAEDEVAVDRQPDDIDGKMAQRSVIAFLTRKGFGPTAIRQEMVSVYGDSCLKLAQVKV
jgi:hypothetical protein